MVTGYEVEMYHNIGRIAAALERVADAAEIKVFGVTGREVAEAKQRLREDMKAAES
jgi:hypothetical protein